MDPGDVGRWHRRKACMHNPTIPVRHSPRVEKSYYSGCRSTFLSKAREAWRGYLALLWCLQPHITGQPKLPLLLGRGK